MSTKTQLNVEIVLQARDNPESTLKSTPKSNVSSLFLSIWGSFHRYF